MPLRWPEPSMKRGRLNGKNLRWIINELVNQYGNAVNANYINGFFVSKQDTTTQQYQKIEDKYVNNNYLQ